MLKLLKVPPVYCAVVNRYAEPEASRYLRNLNCRDIEGLPFACYSNCCTPCSASSPPPFPPSPQSKDKLLYYYAMDMASLYPVLALGVCASDTVLDMCAAPGGKAFAMLQLLSWEGGAALAMNDASSSRVKRLQQVVRQCMGRGVKYSVRVTRQRGELLGEMEPNEYDRILVDAPCSSDRHNIREWIRKRNYWPSSAEFAKVQQGLVLSALHAAKPGSTVVYSTCTMSPVENDGVIASALESAQKLGYQVDVVAAPLNKVLEGNLFGTVQMTDYGKLIIPSQTLNIGPMYISKLHLIRK